MTDPAEGTASFLRPVTGEPAPHDIGGPPMPAASRKEAASFNRLWLGQTVSSFGSQISLVAIPLTAVLYLDAGPREVGFLSACERLALLGPALLFGVLVDRVRRRPLMISADLVRAALFGLVPVLAWLGQLSMGALYLIVFAGGCLSGLFDLAYRAYLPCLVSPELLERGNRRLQSTDSFAQIMGPTAGGVLVSALRAPFAVLVDAASFLVSALAIAAVPVAEGPAHRDGPEKPEQTWRSLPQMIGEGMRALVGDPVLRTLAGTSAVFNFSTGILLTLFVPYAARDRGMSAAEIGIVNAFFGVGGVLGALLVGRALRTLGYGRLIFAANCLAVAAIVCIPFVGGSGLLPTALFCFAYFVAGLTIIAGGIAEMTVRQLTVPPHLLGRVMATYQFAIGGLVPVSALVAGLLGEAIGMRATLFLAAATIPCSLLWFVRSPLFHLRSINAGATEDKEAT